MSFVKDCCWIAIVCVVDGFGVNAKQYLGRGILVSSCISIETWGDRTDFSLVMLEINDFCAICDIRT